MNKEKKVKVHFQSNEYLRERIKQLEEQISSILKMHNDFLIRMMQESINIAFGDYNNFSLKVCNACGGKGNVFMPSLKPDGHQTIELIDCRDCQGRGFLDNKLKKE